MFGTILSLSVGAALYYVGRYLAFRSFLAGREELGDAELASCFTEAVHLPEEAVLKLLREIGRCYRVPYGVLRPGDLFAKGLAAIDSFFFGRGDREFREYLRETYSRKIAVRKSSMTISMLMQELSLEKLSTVDAKKRVGADGL